MGDTPTRPGHPLAQLTLARLREFYREPAAVFWVYGFPLILAFGLGLAFRNRPVETIRLDVRTDGPGGTAAVERLLDGFRRVPGWAVVVAGEKPAESADTRTKLLVTPGDEVACRNRLRTAKTDLVVTPPADASQPPEYLVEPNRPESVLARNAADNAWIRLQSPGLPQPRESIIDEPGGRYIDFLLPGLLGTNLMGGGLWGVGFVVVDMRVRKLLKRFLATPMKRSHFLISLGLSRLAFTLVEVVLLLGFGYLVFGMRVRGDWTAFAGLCVAGGVGFAGIGLLVASRAKTIETVSGLMNAVMLPMYVLGGVFFSSDRFPDEAQPLVRALPLTWLNDGLRAVVNDGAGWEAAWKPCLILSAWAVVCFALALRLFRWR